LELKILKTLNKMKNLDQDDKAYTRARHKVEKIKGFYKHLAVYLIVNTFIYGLKFVRNQNFDVSITVIWPNINFGGLWLYWGIGVAFHGLSVFGCIYLFGKKWEQDKIKQFMEEEERSANSKNRGDGKL
jgi:hypothetical protein